MPVELRDGGAAFGLGLRSARNPQTVLLLRTGQRRGGDPPPRREEARAVRDDRIAQLERERLVGLEPQAHRGRHAVIGRPLEVLDQIGPRVVVPAVRAVPDVGQPDVLVRVDQRGNHRLPRQVHARGARRRLALALAPHPGEDAVLDEERGALAGRVPAAVDEPGALEPHPGRCRPRRLARGPAEYRQVAVREVEVDLALEREARGQDLLDRLCLADAQMRHAAGRRHAGNPVVVQHHPAAARLQRPVDAAEDHRRILEVMVRVGREHEVDGCRRQLDGLAGAAHHAHVVQPLGGELPGQELDPVGRDLDGVDGPRPPHDRGHQRRVKAGARADVRHRHARPEPQRGDHVVPARERLALGRLEAGGHRRRVEVGAPETLVDVLAGRCRLGRRETAPERGHDDKDESASQ